MKLDVTGVFRDAWAMWSRDRDLLTRVAGPFLFLPQFALLLLVPEPPAMPAAGADQGAVAAWLDQFFGWYGRHGAVLVAGDLLTLFGALVILMLYLDARRLDLRGAMLAGLRLLPRYVLASILVVVPVGLGLLLILPGIYLQGRLLLVGPILVAERPIAATRAIGRSVVLTRGLGFVAAGIACVMLFAGRLLSAPFLALGGSLGGAPIANPVTAALLDAAASAAMAAAALAAILVRIALYRRLASRGI